MINQLQFDGHLVAIYPGEVSERRSLLRIGAGIAPGHRMYRVIKVKIRDVTERTDLIETELAGEHLVRQLEGRTGPVVGRLMRITNRTWERRKQPAFWTLVHATATDELDALGVRTTPEPHRHRASCHGPIGELQCDDRWP